MASLLALYRDRGLKQKFKKEDFMISIVVINEAFDHKKRKFKKFALLP